MASPVTLTKITFSERPVGTTNPVYAFHDILADGKVLNVAFKGEIVTDVADPTSPAISANASYHGPVVVKFNFPVSAVSFDAGEFNAAGSTEIKIVGRNGFVVKKVLNPVSGHNQYSHFSFDFGENAIREIDLNPVGDEQAGFALDNLSVTVRSESRDVALSGKLAIDNLMSGSAWNGSNISFSFLETTSKMPGYGTGPETFAGSNNRVATMGVFNDAQRNMAKAALNEWSGVADLRFGQVNETPNGAPGMLRFGTAAIVAPADAFLPALDPEAGDVRIKTGTLLGGAVHGTFDYLTFMHELGHALGLKHPHEAGDLGPVMPADKDSLEFSVMSYRSYPGEPVDGSSFQTPAGSFPQSLMMNDIAAIQYLYGANFSHASGDTNYQFDPGRAKIFLTIWDGGGNDTYDLTRYATKLSLDLRPGQWSVFDQSQLAVLKPGPGQILARGNVFNALQYQNDPRSLIENALGGSNDDKIVGNEAANKLDGRRGNDLLDALGGNDYVLGDLGNDKLLGGSGNDHLGGGLGHDDLSGGPGKDTFVFKAASESLSGATNHDLIEDFIQGDDQIDLSTLDADATTTGTQHFTFIGLSSATGAGKLSYHYTGDYTIIVGNVGNPATPFEVELHGKIALAAGDFHLA